MKRISTNDLVPGMITAEDVYTYSNQLILPKGLVLTDKSITKLEFYSILSIRVEDETSPTMAPVSDTMSYAERIQASPEFKEYKQRFEKNVINFRNSIQSIVEKNVPLDIDILLSDTLELLDSKHGKVDVFSMLHNMRMYDDHTFTHSINVALICNVFAGWLHLSEEEVHLATLCGLLHDIGKLMIPESIIKKPNKLTANEYNIVKTHTIEGYNILNDAPINDHIKNAALMHHERFDGTGYPLGLAGEKIDPYANIVSIADVYDAMTSARVYRGPLCPFKALDMFVSEGLQKYETNAILTFIRNIVTTYLGNRVRLSNGMEGEIIYINQHNLARPTIKCGNCYVDLAQEMSVSIEEII